MDLPPHFLPHDRQESSATATMMDNTDFTAKPNPIGNRDGKKAKRFLHWEQDYVKNERYAVPSKKRPGRCPGLQG